MKIDWNLLRLLLLKSLESPAGHQPIIDGFSDEDIGFHAHMAIKLGLADGYSRRNQGYRRPYDVITALTDLGCEFVELVRDEGRWRAGLITAERSGAVTLTRLSAIFAQPSGAPIQEDSPPARPASTVLTAINSTNADIWRSLSADFSHLADDERKMLRDNRGEKPTTASCMYRACDPPHGWVDISASINGQVSDRFEEIATRAGIERGCPPAVRPLEFWVHCLFQDLLARDRKELFKPIAEGGVIPAVIPASANYCLRLATEAAEQCHREQQPNTRTALAASQALDLGGGEGSGLAFKGSLQSSVFWKSRQGEFEKYGAQFPDLAAVWDVLSCTWFLTYRSAADGWVAPGDECAIMLAAIARNAVLGLPDRGTYISPDTGPRVADDAESWQVWLDFMRFQTWGFRETSSPTACTEYEWDLGVKDGKALQAIRRERQYTTGDEWKEVYRRTPSGDLQRLSEEELKGKTSKDLEGHYHWLPNGTIAQVFQTSARFCEELASRVASEADPDLDSAAGRPQRGEPDESEQKGMKQDSRPGRAADFGGVQGQRPEICFVDWCSMPGEPTPLRLSHTGFLLENDGIAAHDISIEEFRVGDELWTGEEIARIKRDGEGFMLLRSKTPTQRWNLLGAMNHAASVQNVGTPKQTNCTVRIRARYRDAANVWYGSWADLRHVPGQGTVLGDLRFGPTTHGQLESGDSMISSITEASATAKDGSAIDAEIKTPPPPPASNPTAAGSAAGHEKANYGGGTPGALWQPMGTRPESATKLNGDENVGNADRDSGANRSNSPPRRIPDLESSRARLNLVATLARELATIKQDLVGYCTAEGLKAKHPEFVLWEHLEHSEVKELAAGMDFTPKAYAENLTLRKFGISSRQTLKKDRRKLRRAEKTKES